MNYTSEDLPLEHRILEQIAKENPTLTSLHKNLLLQLSRPFNVNGSGIDLLIGIRKKIAKLCYDNKQQCMQYIKLPKFTKISMDAQRSLQKIISQIWSTFLSNKCQFRMKQNANKERQQSKYMKQMEQFHLRNFSMFCQFYNSHNQNQLMRLPILNYQPPNPINPIQNNMIYSTSFQNPGNLNQPQSLNMPPPLGLPALKIPSNEVSTKIQQQVQNPSNLYAEKKSPHFKKNKEPTSPLPGASKLFVGCACKGKVSADDTHFQCDLCNRKYHFLCFQILIPPIEEVIKMTCPLCELKNMNINIFYDIVGDPLECSWVLEKDLFSKKITIKAKKCKEIMENNYSVHIRSIKIKGNKYRKFLQKDFTEEQVKKPLIQIKINNNLLQRNGDDSKISIMDPPEGYEEKKKQQLIFFVVCMVKKNSIQQVLEKIKNNSVNESYISKHLGNKSQLKIHIVNQGGKIIKIPGRGIDCDHYQVFDIEEFININEEGSQVCKFCEKNCRSFQIDEFLCSAIKILKEKESEETLLKCQAIYYQRNGEIILKKQQMVHQDK